MSADASTRLMTAAERRDYDAGWRCGANDFRRDSKYDPDPRFPMWSQGYCDGWMSAADEADRKARSS